MERILRPVKAAWTSPRQTNSVQKRSLSSPPSTHSWAIIGPSPMWRPTAASSSVLSAMRSALKDDSGRTGLSATGKRSAAAAAATSATPSTRHDCGWSTPARSQ